MLGVQQTRECWTETANRSARRNARAQKCSTTRSDATNPLNSCAQIDVPKIAAKSGRGHHHLDRRGTIDRPSLGSRLGVTPFSGIRFAVRPQSSLPVCLRMNK